MDRARRLFVVLLCVFALANCNLPRVTITTGETATPVPLTPTESATPTPTTAELGLAENPLILALPPSANTNEQINAAKEIASQLTERTGYVFVTVIPDSYADLVDAFEKGNAHIALLDPLSYALAYEKDLVRATYASLNEEGRDQYGAQFIATRKGGFKSYFDPGTGTNTADASVALAQFNDRKPCWSEETSPSGFVVPLGFLNKNNVFTRPAAFVGGHPTVVRSLYLGGICDFGATYIDARKFPSLEDQYPDLMEQVIVVWQTPEIIPYGIFAFSTEMPSPMRDLISGFIPAILQTDDGNAAFKIAYGYGVDEWKPINDGDLKDFLAYVRESRVDIQGLLK